MRETFVSALTMVFSLTIPATAGLIVLSEPIIRLIFERGAFNAADTIATAETLSLYAIGLFAYSANKILVPVFYALKDTRFPVIASFLAVAVNILIITQTIDLFQHRAIALSTSCTMVINFLFLSTILYWKLDGYSLSYLGKGLLKIITATVAMTLLLLIFRPLFSDWLLGNIWQKLLATMLLITSGAASYSLILSFLKLPELDVIIKKLQNRLQKK